MAVSRNPQQLFDARYKIIVIGEATVGKTSLIHAAMGKKFDPTLISTIGVDFAKRIYTVDGHRIQLEMWDTAGQERFRSLSTMHYRDAKGFIIVFDLTNKDSFDRVIKDWIPSIDAHITDQAPVFFVGNKLDLQEYRAVSKEDGEKLARKQCSTLYVETSAKIGENVDQLFYQVAESMIAFFGAPKRYYEMELKEQFQGYDDQPQMHPYNNNGSVRLELRNAKKFTPEKARCCKTS